MLQVIRYINGKKVQEEDLRKIAIESDLILQIIDDVNKRINISANIHLSTKIVEKSI